MGARRLKDLLAGWDDPLEYTVPAPGIGMCFGRLIMRGKLRILKDDEFR